MKHQMLVSALAVLVVFAATTTADAGIFGRLSTVWHGCAPCEPVACQPCEVVACQPCEVVACQPCEVVCNPCACCDSRGYRPFRPFGGLFTRLTAVRCAPVCDPCEPIACNPCEVVACDPCEAVCGPRLPFGGFFLNMKARLAAVKCAPVCDPCEPVACDPCAACCR